QLPAEATLLRRPPPFACPLARPLACLLHPFLLGRPAGRAMPLDLRTVPRDAAFSADTTCRAVAVDLGLTPLGSATRAFADAANLGLQAFSSRVDGRCALGDELRWSTASRRPPPRN